MDLSDAEKKAFRAAYDFFNTYSHMPLNGDTFGKAADEMSKTIDTFTDTPLTKRLMFAVYETLDDLCLAERRAGHDKGAAAQGG